MSRRTKFGLIAAILIVVVGGLFFLTAANRNKRAVEVRFDTVKAQDLVASVTASGRIEPQTKVDISADITGRITQIAVKEGDWVKKGQFLLQIDSANPTATAKSVQASIQALQREVESARASHAQARADFERADKNKDGAIEESEFTPALVDGGE